MKESTENNEYECSKCSEAAAANLLYAGFSSPECRAYPCCCRGVIVSKSKGKALQPCQCDHSDVIDVLVTLACASETKDSCKISEIRKKLVKEKFEVKEKTLKLFYELVSIIRKDRKKGGVICSALNSVYSKSKQEKGLKSND